MTTPARQRVQLTPASAVRVVAVAVATLAVLVSLDRSRLILHWLVTAAAAALLLDGPVRALARFVRRGLAVTAVTVLTLVGAALLTYGVVDAVVEQYDRLRDAAPAAAERLEDQYDSAREVRLAERTDAFVAEAPERLLGSPADAARTTAERLGEVLLVLTLTVFMLVAYERFEQRLLDVDGAHQRWAGLDAGVGAGARSARYAVGRALVLGAAAGLVGQLADVPAPFALGLWMAWWRLLPLLGTVVGYAPLVLLLVTERHALVTVVALAVLGVVEVCVWWALHGMHARDILGVPMGVVTVVAFSGGVEMAGVVGAVVAVVAAHVAVGAARAALPVSSPGEVTC